jgi:hypothetical protein
MKLTIILSSMFLTCSMYAADLPIATPISTVPLVITKPGHYYFVADLYFKMPTTTSPSTAITVNATGPVVIDMRGFTLNGADRIDFPTAGYITIDPTGILIQSSNVTVMNGEVYGFWNGLMASGSSTAYLTGINLEGIEFFLSGNDGSEFNYVNNSIVKNCHYIYNYAGTSDGFTQTGNSYINDRVQDSDNPQWAFRVVAPFNSKIIYSYTAIPSQSAK